MSFVQKSGSVFMTFTLCEIVHELEIPSTVLTLRQRYQVMFYVLQVFLVAVISVLRCVVSMTVSQCCCSCWRYH